MLQVHFYAILAAFVICKIVSHVSYKCSYFVFLCSKQCNLSPLRCFMGSMELFYGALGPPEGTSEPLTVLKGPWRGTSEAL